MTVAELIAALTGRDPDGPVAVSTECHGCFSNEVRVVLDDDGGAIIVG